MDANHLHAKAGKRSECWEPKQLYGREWMALLRAGDTAGAEGFPEQLTWRTRKGISGKRKEPLQRCGGWKQHCDRGNYIHWGGKVRRGCGKIQGKCSRARWQRGLFGRGRSWSPLLRPVGRMGTFSFLPSFLPSFLFVSVLVSRRLLWLYHRAFDVWVSSKL